MAGAELPLPLTLVERVAVPYRKSLFDVVALSARLTSRPVIDDLIVYTGGGWFKSIATVPCCLPPKKMKVNGSRVKIPFSYRNDDDIWSSTKVPNLTRSIDALPVATKVLKSGATLVLSSNGALPEMVSSGYGGIAASANSAGRSAFSIDSDVRCRVAPFRPASAA